MKKQMMGKVDLKDRTELPKPDMRVAILDIQHKLMVEGIMVVLFRKRSTIQGWALKFALTFQPHS
jgi:hypothetical protein